MGRVARAIPELSANDVANFEARIMMDPNSGCWLWTGSISGNGYGRFWMGGLQIPAHRIAYQMHKSSVPLDKVLDHLCLNSHCVNPNHLEIVSYRENVLRGNCITAQQARQTHCKNGHLLSGENLILRRDPNGFSRLCKTCKYSRDYASDARRRKIAKGFAVALMAVAMVGCAGPDIDPRDVQVTQ